MINPEKNRKTTTRFTAAKAGRPWRDLEIFLHFFPGLSPGATNIKLLTGFPNGLWSIINAISNAQLQKKSYFGIQDSAVRNSTGCFIIFYMEVNHEN